jgi:uncharacterized protein (DUF433 family)
MDTDKLIQERDGDLYVGPSRVLVPVIATNYNRGARPEEIQERFPTLTLAEVYGAILYYLEHKDELDVRFAEEELRREEFWAAHHAAHAEFHDAMHARFEAARQQKRERGEYANEAAEA